MNLKDALKNIQYEILFGKTDREISGITCDSRKCENNFIFVAIKGFESDGHNYIKQAVEKGASTIIYEANVGLDISEYFSEEITFVKVLESRKVYGYLCGLFYDFPHRKLNLIGVTGTNGKTTISYILEKILSETAVIGTVNYRFKEEIFPCKNTTPEPCELNSFIDKFQKAGAENIVLEVSSHGVDLERVTHLDFDVGIFTNLTSEHLDYHKTMDNYFNAKKRFFTEILKNSNKKNKFAIINTDDDYGKKLKDLECCSVISYGLSNDSDIYPTDYNINISGTEINVKVFDDELKIKTNLIGEHNILNILAALGVAKVLDCDLKTIEKIFNSEITIPGRLERVTKNGNVFVDYAHTQDALKNVLTSLNKIKKKNGKIITLFGCGGDRDKSKRPKMGYSAAKLSDFVIVTSDNPRTENPVMIIENILDGVKKAVRKDLIGENSYRVIPDRKDAIKMAINIAKEDDIILIAGKGHENYQIMGKEKINFNDKEIALKYLNEK